MPKSRARAIAEDIAAYENQVVIMNQEPRSGMPYTKDASEFVRRVAALTLFQESGYAKERCEDGHPFEWLESQHYALEALITEARKLCGMED